MVFPSFPAVYHVHSWRTRKSLYSKVSWAGVWGNRGFGRIRAFTQGTHAKAAGNSSIANQEYVSGYGTFQNVGILKKKHPISSGLVDSPVLRPPCIGLHTFELLTFSRNISGSHFIFQALCPFSPAKCPLPGSPIYDRFLSLAKSDSFQGSIWLGLSSKRLVPILVSLFLCSWLHMSESSFLERIGHLLQGKSAFLKSTNG